MQPILEKLYRAESMSQQESQQLFSAIVRGELEPSQLAAALISMKVRGERPEEIAGAAKALLDDAQPFPRPDYPFADIVGTGGDGTNSINISTASAFVAAACGAKIAKHGNRSVSSRSGSSDLLAAFGIRLDLPAEEARNRQPLLRLLHAPHRRKERRFRLRHDPVEKHHALHPLRQRFSQRYRQPAGVRHRQGDHVIQTQRRQQLAHILQQIVRRQRHLRGFRRQAMAPPVDADHPITFGRQSNERLEHGFRFAPAGQQHQRERP